MRRVVPHTTHHRTSPDQVKISGFTLRLNTLLRSVPQPLVGTAAPRELRLVVWSFVRFGNGLSILDFRPLDAATCAALSRGFGLGGWEADVSWKRPYQSPWPVGGTCVPPLSKELSRR